MTTEAALTFKQEMEKLEKGIRELESGRLDLDEALARFEEDIALHPSPAKRLDEAEGRIEQLLADGTTEELDVA